MYNHERNIETDLDVQAQADSVVMCFIDSIIHEAEKCNCAQHKRTAYKAKKWFGYIQLPQNAKIYDRPEK